MPGFEPRLSMLVATSLSSVAGWGMLVATVVVIALLGRRYRPRSSGLLFGWSIATMVWGFVRLGMGVATPLVVHRLGGGFDRVMDIQAGVLILGTVVHVVLGVVFLIGLARVMRENFGDAATR